jgi:YCII-related domain-containing protein
MRFMLLYSGPATPPDASHEGWPEWFKKLGDRLVDRGSPMIGGRVVHGDGSSSDSAAHLNGYSIIQAEDLDEAVRLVRDHPFLAHRHECSVEIHPLP